MKLLVFVFSLLSALLAPTEQATLAISGLDPVLLIEGSRQEGSEELTATYDGFSYRFATEKSLSDFRAAPDRYAVQLRGACPVRPDLKGKPEIFLVHEGRIYLFFSEHCRARFEASPDVFLDALDVRGSAGTSGL